MLEKCPAYRLIGTTHYCGLGTDGDLLCWKAHNRNCPFDKLVSNPKLGGDCVNNETALVQPPENRRVTGNTRNRGCST